MEVHRLNELIKHPDLLGNDSLVELRSLLTYYPYFQTAWILYLKNLFILNDPSFKNELRRGALYVSDLTVLFYFIEGEKFILNKSFMPLESDGEGISNRDRTLDLIDKFLYGSSDGGDYPKDLPLPVEATSDYTSVLLSSIAGENDSKKEEIPLKGHELIDSFIEKSESKQTVSDVLVEDTIDQYDKYDEEVYYELTDSGSDNGGAEDDEDTKTDVQAEENTEGEEYLTETLAKIYVKQRRYDKAIEIIKKLNLKYPKKNAYFADQIRFLEKLIINTKSK